MQIHTETREHVGTYAFIAPECAASVMNCCFASDWWAVGAVAFQLFHAETEYCFNIRELSEFLRPGNFELEKIKNRIKDTNLEIQLFVSRFLRPDPEKRAKFDNIQRIELQKLLKTESVLLSKN